MSVEVIDLSNYKDRSGARVPEGEYLVTVEDIEVGESRNKDVMWTVFLRIVGGEQDGQPLVDRLTMTERAMFRVVGFLGGMGVKVMRKRIKVDTARLIGKKARVQVSDGEPYNGTIRSEVRGYTRFTSVKPENASDADLDDVEENEGVEEKASAAKPTRTRRAQPAPEPEPEEEEYEDDDPETSDDEEIDLDDIEV